MIDRRESNYDQYRSTLNELEGDTSLVGSESIAAHAAVDAHLQEKYGLDPIALPEGVKTLIAKAVVALVEEGY